MTRFDRRIVMLLILCAVIIMPVLATAGPYYPINQLSSDEFTPEYLNAYRFQTPWAPDATSAPRVIETLSRRTMDFAVVNLGTGEYSRLLTSPGGSVITSYPNGTLVMIVSREGSYTRVRMGGEAGTLEGYMLSTNLLDTKPLTSAARIRAVKPPYVRNGPDTVDIYVSPDESGDRTNIIVPDDESLLVIEQMGTWIHVISFDGSITGYVRVQDVKMSIMFSDLGISEEEMPRKYAIVSNPKSTDRLNLRASPQTTAKALDRYFNGTIVEILDGSEEGIDQWAYVLVDGKRGYMCWQYLRILSLVRDMNVGHG